LWTVLALKSAPVAQSEFCGPTYVAAMPRYFFHTEEDWAQEPVELPDDASARNYAMRAARELLAEAVLQGRLILHETIIAHSEDGRHLFTITLGEAVGLPPPGSK
jgi:hypothetical protein